MSDMMNHPYNQHRQRQAVAPSTEIHFPSAEMFQQQWSKGNYYIMVSTAPDGHRGWIFGESAFELRRTAAIMQHTDVVILSAEYMGGFEDGI